MIDKKAACHCGNIHAKVSLSKGIAQYTPRACDCDFCSRHGAAYISDPAGRLSIFIRNPDKATMYRQGDDLVDLHICTNCGVLVAVTFAKDGSVWGGVNATALTERSDLPKPESASPRQLSATEKIDRWQRLWFPDVTIERGAR